MYIGNPKSVIRNPKRAQRGAILILVLWLLLILSLIGLSYSSSVRTSLTITGNRSNKVKARYYAKAGIERTIAELLLLTDGYYDELSGFYDDEARLANQPIGDGIFSLLSGRRRDTGEIIYGITDEADRLNLNTATEDALYGFLEMTTDMCDSLLDWRDTDSETRSDGAEDDYYQMLDDPYFCKNRDFQTVSELLFVRGWTPAFLYGEDANGNGRLEPSEDDGDRSLPLDDADGELDLGLGQFFTVYSHDRELNPNNEARADLNSATQEELQQIQGMTETQARSIVAWRGQQQFTSLAGLLNVTVAQQTTQTQQNIPGMRTSQRRGTTLRPSTFQSSSLRQTSFQTSSLRQSSSRDSSLRQSSFTTSTLRMSSRGQGGQTSQQGGQAFTYDQVCQIVDWVCVGSDDKRNRININTAPLEVLMTLPGVDESLANEIVTRRSSSQGPFTGRGDLSSVNGMTQEIFQGLIDYVTVQSYQFHIVAEGRSGEAKTTVEAVVDVATNPPKILFWREL
jgi:DNA uptake protein ComE-like DNA-binding protein